MSWDRVIQDSDEDEPLIEDDIPTSIDPQQHPDPPLQHHDPNAEHQIDYPMEHTTKHSSTEPQLNVNFDAFLQSQGSQVALTLSQQHREERWIPSTSEGGGGSIGAMMTEIGLAQQRLLDDEASSAGQRLPSTATPYSSEISQPGSFPAVSMYQYQQMEESANDGFVYARAGQDVSSEATQLVPPAQAHVYDYSTPGTSTHNDSPTAASESMIANPTSVRAHSSQKTIHRSKSLQSAPYSPHDTEPLSSVVSPRLSRAKSDNAKWGPMSPRSPADAHDELSLPAVAVEISTVKKKRGRPKKSSLPEEDEDDELAGPHDSESEQPKPEKKRPGRPRKTAAADAATIQGDANVTDPPEVASKASKKTKSRRSKTADAILQRSHASASDDDVIWVESKPITTNEAENQTDNTSIPTETNPSETYQPAPTTSTKTSLESEETPTAKKRGRKRRKTTEQLASEPDETTKENQLPEPPSKATAPEEKEKPPATTTESIDVEAGENTTPAPTTTTTADPTTPKEAAPQTPQTPQRSEQNKPYPNSNTDPRSTKGPRQHSPISLTSKVPYRVGLSKRARIAPLLKVVRK